METLTNEERAALRSQSEWPDLEDIDKALRIIDQQAARIAELESENARLQKSEAEWKHWRGTAVKACDRAESRLSAATALLREFAGVIGIHCKEDGTRVRAFLAGQPAAPTSAESELAQLRERVAKADSMISEDLFWERTVDGKRALEALRGSDERRSMVAPCGRVLTRAAIEDHLFEDGLHVVDAKQWAVLEAMAKAPDSTVSLWAGGVRDKGWLSEIAWAELARREAE